MFPSMFLSSYCGEFQRLPLSPCSTENCAGVGYPTQMKSTQKYEMYMPNAKTQRQGPNATYMASGVDVGANANFKFCVGAMRANLKGLRIPLKTALALATQHK